MSATTTLAEQDEPVKSEKPSALTTHRTPLSSYRMLYRGSLSLPDSEMLLDGITFVMQIARNSPMSLINSPIPLGLESMRGRSLRLISIISIQDIHVECFGDVSMYIHPEAFLTRSFFERTLCTADPKAPHLPKDNSNQPMTSMAVRIGLGDGTGLDETDILVFGQVSTTAPDEPLSRQPSSTTSLDLIEKHPQILQLLAGRIAPQATQQPSQQRKITRPDDPLPRPHPLASLHLSPGRRGLKRKRSTNNSFGPFHSTIGDTKGNANGDAGSALMAALAQAQAQGERLKKQGKVLLDAPVAKGLVKRPALFQHHHSAPSTSNSTANSRGQSVDRDGFLVPGLPVHALTVRRGDTEKGKSPLKLGDDMAKGSGGSGRTDDLQGQGVNANSSNAAEPESEMESKNKTAIKKRALAALEACGISKQHQQFRDMYGWIHRGVAFAVVRHPFLFNLLDVTNMFLEWVTTNLRLLHYVHQRGVIQDTKVDRDLLTKLVEVHLEMYLGGRGGRYQSQSQSQAQPAASSQLVAPSASDPAQRTSPARKVTTNDLPFGQRQLTNDRAGEGEGGTDSDMDLAFGSRPLTIDQTQLNLLVSEVIFDVSSASLDEHVQ